MRKCYSFANTPIPVFNCFEISPAFVSDLNYASAFYDSEVGRISVEWKREKDRIYFNVTAPEGIVGKVIIGNSSYGLKNGNSEFIIYSDETIDAKWTN